MSVWEILMLAFGVSLDAFSASVSGSLSGCRRPLRNAVTAAVFFGGFQILMPLAGGILGAGLGSLLDKYDHFVAFVLLMLVGINMIREALSTAPDEDKNRCDRFFGLRNMTLMAVATSIDAAAVGASVTLAGFGFFSDLVPTALAMGIVTAGMSLFGVWIGKFCGRWFGHRIGIVGGLALVAIGAKILISHLSA